MAVSTLAEVFAIGAAGGSTAVRSGLPDPLKVIIVACAGRTSSSEGIARLDLRRSFGIATGTTSRMSISDQNDDAADPTATDKMHRDDAILTTLSTAGATDRLHDISVFGTDTCTFIVDDGGGTNLAQNVWYLGGADFTGAELFSFSQKTSAGEQTVALPLADPGCVIFFSAGGAQTINTAEAGSAFMIGACVNVSGVLTQAVATTIAIDAVADADTARYSRSGQCAAFIDPADVTSCAARGSVTSIGGTSMTINWASADATARLIFGLALSGPQFALETFTTLTDTVTQIPIVTTFRPRGGMIVGVSDAEHADDTPTDNDQLAIGFFSSTTARVSVSTANADATAASQSAAGASSDEAIAFVSLDAVPVAEYEIDVASISDTGVTFIHDTAAAAATDFQWVLLIGDGLPSDGVQPQFWRWHY